MTQLENNLWSSRCDRRISSLIVFRYTTEKLNQFRRWSQYAIKLYSTQFDKEWKHGKIILILIKYFFNFIWFCKLEKPNCSFD